MAQIETWMDCDLKKPVLMHHPQGLLFSEDNMGNLIGVNVYSDGNPVTLSGTVTGYCILANGTSIPVSGTRSANKAYVVLPAVAYSVPGLIVVVLKLTEEASVTTLAALSATVVGIGNVPADPSQATIEAWTAHINAAIAVVEGNSVRYDTTQSLTAAQKATARANIGAGTYAENLHDEDFRVVIPGL